MLEEFEALGCEHLGGAHVPVVAPAMVSRDLGEGVFGMGLGSDRVKNEVVGERLVVDLEDFFGGIRGGGDDGGDGAKVEGHKRAIELGHGRKCLMGAEA